MNDMRAETVTFSSDQHGPASAVDSLVGIGFEFGPPRPITQTVLDTFDGRLDQAGLRLEVTDADGLWLGLSGVDTVAVQLAISAVPRFAGDVPNGPVRARLAELIDVRALLPVMSMSSSCTAGSARDRAGKVVVTVALRERLHIEDRDARLAEPAVSWTVEIDQMAGYARHARRAHDALTELGLTRFDGDTFTLVAQATGIDLAGFTASPTVPLDPSMAAIDGFRAVLGNLAETIAANWQGTLDQVDPEFLHELRVAIRRTRAVVANGKKVLPPAVFHRADEQFAWLGALTGPARDLDVYLIEWNHYTADLDADVVVALEPVRAVLAQRHDAAVANLLRGLASFQAADTMSWWRAWLAESPSDIDGDHAAGRQANRPLGQVVARRIARAHRVLVDDGRRIDADSPAAQVHDLRKQAKKLRYLFDCFGSLLPKSPRKQFVSRLKTLQDILGQHQDA